MSAEQTPEPPLRPLAQTVKVGPAVLDIEGGWYRAPARCGAVPSLDVAAARLFEQLEADEDER